MFRAGRRHSPFIEFIDILVLVSDEGTTSAAGEVFWRFLFVGLAAMMEGRSVGEFLSDVFRRENHFGILV